MYLYFSWIYRQEKYSLTISYLNPLSGKQCSCWLNLPHILCWLVCLSLWFSCSGRLSHWRHRLNQSWKIAMTSSTGWFENSRRWVSGIQWGRVEVRRGWVGIVRKFMMWNGERGLCIVVKCHPEHRVDNPTVSPELIHLYAMTLLLQFYGAVYEQLNCTCVHLVSDLLYAHPCWLFVMPSTA